MIFVRSACFLAALGLLNGAGLAMGQSADPSMPNGAESAGANPNRERAKQLYEEGLTAYRAGKYSDAIDKLLEADHVMPNAAFSYNIALVYQAMGDKRSALRWLRGYLRQSGKSDDAATIGKVKGLEAEFQSKGIQQVTILSSPPGAALRIDGNALGITPFTIEITPGSHQATLVLDGYQAVQRTFDLRPDRSMDVDVQLAAVQSGSSPAMPAMQPNVTPLPTAVNATPMQAVIPPPDSAPHHRRVQPLTWVSLGVGTALLGGAVYFELKREKDERDARNASQRDYQAAYDRMQAGQLAARILAVAGSIVAVTGGVLLTVDLTHQGPTQTANVSNCGVQGICAAWRGQF